MDYELVADSDVRTVLVFMQEEIPAGKLVKVAEAVAKIGEILWARHRPEEVIGLSFAGKLPIGGLQSLSAANVYALAQGYADGDSAAVADAPRSKPPHGRILHNDKCPIEAFRS